MLPFLAFEPQVVVEVGGAAGSRPTADCSTVRRRAIFVISPTIPGMDFLESSLRSRQSACVPEASDLQDLPDQGRWNTLRKATMETQSQSDLSFDRQGNVISWEQNGLKAVSPLELGE